ncbi:MAG: DUF2798 domain-containing protein [Myxococcota bacterium]
MFAVLMSLGMSFIMSFVMTAANVGMVEQFVFIWLKGFAVGFLAALPSAMLVAPIAQRIVRRFGPPDGP